MADCMLYKGGTPAVNYMWCEDDYEQWKPPVGLHNLKHTPPYDAHIDGTYGAYNYFTVGFPFYPVPWDWGKWQGKALRACKVTVGDFIGMFMMPSNHYATNLRFDVARPDAGMAGATVKLSARKINWDAVNLKWTFDATTDVEDAVTAAALTTNIPVDDQSSNYVPLSKVVAGYNRPLYCDPVIVTGSDGVKLRYHSAIVFGLEVVTMPTDTTLTLADAKNDWYLGLKIEGFESPVSM